MAGAGTAVSPGPIPSVTEQCGPTKQSEIMLVRFPTGLRCFQVICCHIACRKRNFKGSKRQDVAAPV